MVISKLLESSLDLVDQKGLEYAVEERINAWNLVLDGRYDTVVGFNERNQWLELGETVFYSELFPISSRPQFTEELAQ